MKPLSEPHLIPLTAPFYHGKGTLPIFSLENLQEMCAGSLFKAVCFTWLFSLWPIFGFGSTFSLSSQPLVLRAFLGSVFLFLIFPAILHCFFGFLYSTFSAKDKNKEEHSTILVS